MTLWNVTASRHLGLIAAGVAFFAMLAVFPAMAAVVAIWGFVADPAAVAQELASTSEFLPPEAFELLNTQVQGLISVDRGTLGWTTAVTIGAALWSARAGVAALVQGINAIFGVENRSGPRHLLASMTLTMVLIGAALVATAAGVGVPVILALVPLGPFEAALITAARWAVAPAVTILGIGMMYRYGPNLPGPRPSLLSPGLLVAVVLWVAASEGFSIYLTNFSSYNKVYGTLGAVVALLMWFYLSAYAILVGAAVNAALADDKATRKGGQ
ncbi:MAG: YihY/virulence factor BrkB family protein [Gemmobacter sp.]|nr:YihY/virulence factor BrkB family protein [Gemmobacter sp.]